MKLGREGLIRVLLAAFWLSAGVAHGAAVNEMLVGQAAENWLREGAAFLGHEASVESVGQYEGSQGTLWLVWLRPSGYLIMGGDDRLPPVVAFNGENSPDGNLSETLQALLVRQGGIFAEVLAASAQTRGEHDRETENRRLWQALLNPTRAGLETPASIIRQPMLTTTWNQDEPYNTYCPSDSDNGASHTLTGCVPCAVAQLTAFHAWPPSGVGSGSFTDNAGSIRGRFYADFSVPYNWSIMPDVCLDTTSPSAGSLAVARLMAESAVLVSQNTEEADYELEGTSATAWYIRNQLAQFFRYSDDMQYGDFREGYIGHVEQSELYERIRTDMVEGRPAVVCSDSHAFIADGLGTLSGQDYYHFNYGWGDNQNGWFLLTDGYRETVVLYATTNIKPAPVAVFKPMATMQPAAFTLAWDFPKTVTASAFRLTRTSVQTNSSTVISSAISGTVRSYSLRGQNGTNTYTLEANVGGIWREVSDGVTITVSADAPSESLTLTMDDSLKCIGGSTSSLIVNANRALTDVTVACSRPDLVSASSVSGSGSSRTICVTSAVGACGNALLYVTAMDAYGATVKRAVSLNFMKYGTLVLKAGWNWVGFTVLPEKKTIGTVLGTAGFSKNDIVLGLGGQATFTGSKWLPSTMKMAFGTLYQIYVANDVTVTVRGEACPTNTVQLAAGWNWIANSTMTDVTPSELTFEGGFTANDSMMDAMSQVRYTGESWLPSSGFTLASGAGYQIYVANDGTLTFPVTTVDETRYAVVDLSGGPSATRYYVRYSATGPNLNDDTCRTTELWLRKIPAGTFMMGSPEDEVGRWNDESPHEVTLTQDFYIGVFECTQKQWELVMGNNPSAYEGDGRPVERVSYSRIRGTGRQAGAGWPMYGHAVDASSFMGKLQEKTGLMFELPTEAQWEYACRAGSTTALNSGQNLTNMDSDAAMDEVGRYYYNQSDGRGEYMQHTKVGSYLPNAWGLYDMHGNVQEWCLDWSGISNEMMTDPIGPTAGAVRVLCGGAWNDDAQNCRSASQRGYGPSGSYNTNGFRVVFSLARP